MYCLAADIEALRAAGVAILRISPQSRDTRQVLQVIRATCDGRLGGVDARQRLAALSPGELWNGFWHGRPGMEAAA